MSCHWRSKLLPWRVPGTIWYTNIILYLHICTCVCLSSDVYIYIFIFPRNICIYAYIQGKDIPHKYVYVENLPNIHT